MSREYEAMLRGERPVILEPMQSSVSCLTPKYQIPIGRRTPKRLTGNATADKNHDSVFMEIINNRSIFTLPGQGEQTNDKCGEWTHPLSCPNHGQMTLDGLIHDRYVATHSCHNPNCPVCYESWASRQAVNSSDRLIQAIGLYKHEGHQIGRVNHIVFSPPQDIAKELIRTPGGSRRLRTMAGEHAKKAGVRGGAMIFHPFRQNDPREDNFRPDLKPYVWYASPHFHVIGFGWLKKSNDFYDQTGWIYHNVGRRETIKGTIKYTLTHCGIAKGFQAVTYFGMISNNKIVIDSIQRVTEAIKCQACGEELHLYGMTEADEGYDIDWKNDRGVYLHVVVKKAYKLRNVLKRGRVPCIEVGPEKRLEYEQSRLIIGG
ncbi:MAG: hypothetical protein O8C61_03265 [Candidatus Methanoperedens sp.]|nr:hypothetical protein [Candidatus Methanoperedens sp.]